MEEAQEKNVAMDSLSVPSLRIIKARLATLLHESCQFGATQQWGKDPTETGMARLTLSDSDQLVRDWFMGYATSLGCKTSIDQMGNLFAIRPGKNKDLPPVIWGVVSGLDIIKTLNNNHVETEGPTGVVNWTIYTSSGDAARFLKMSVASGVWAEFIPLQTAWGLREAHAANPQSMKQELDRIGYTGGVQASYKSNPVAAYFELHIERIKAHKWFTITVRGRCFHAGTTPFHIRKDPVLCATKLVVASEAIAKRFNGLATTGQFAAYPGTVNSMVHTVYFTLDIRHAQDDILTKMVQECETEFLCIAQHDSEKGCQVEWKFWSGNQAVNFDKRCIASIEEAAADVCSTLPQNKAVKLWRQIVGGAGHDGSYTSHRCPTGMIYTPARAGISLDPREYCSPEDCALGASLDDFLLSLERHYISGEFADAVITCKGQVFNIHRVVLSAHSKYFAKALGGNWKESIERKIEIKDFDPIIVGVMLCFVYTFDYDEPSDAKSMLFHAEVYKFADMYNIPALKECSKKKFASAMNADWNTDDFPYAISEVYKNTPLEDRGLRDLAVAITREHIKTLIGRDDFSRLLRKTADFSADLIPFLCGGNSGDGIQMAHGHPQGRDVCPNCLQPKRIVLGAAHFGAGYINALPRCYCA
ncbi:hypothetical protein FAUST_966 [Fusarium austroamericanum]|uniref:BTB domain-containing protein n=1 Tax=Fusarium austroamericanum TaxID=282268 RepID=A0AAN6C9Q2_FUSAU|nr:hypothetical protein FAUST_966 [Fusarium austroamericanum]